MSFIILLVKIFLYTVAFVVIRALWLDFYSLTSIGLSNQLVKGIEDYSKRLDKEREDKAKLDAMHKRQEELRKQMEEYTR